MITPARNVKGIISEAYDIHSKEKYNRGDTRRRSHVHSEEFRNQQVHAAEKGEKRESRGKINKHDVVVGVNVKRVEKGVSVRFRRPMEAVRKLEVFLNSGRFFSRMKNSRHCYATM